MSVDRRSDIPARTVYFVTSNVNKLREAERMLGLSVVPLEVELEEIQSDDVETVALRKLDAARSRCDGKVFVEDVALCLDELGGFPGPFVKWLLKAAGGDGLGAIASGLDSRSATALCSVAYWDGESVYSFVGSIRGQILESPRGSLEFGWDAWFLPDGSGKTFGEMASAEKDLCSHRARAYAQLRELLQKPG